MKPASLFLLCGLLLLAGCSQEAPPEPPMAPPKVSVAALVEQEVTPFADFTGRAAAVDAVKIRARVWGHLEAIKFTEGADVKKDDVLFIIDRRPYKAAFDRTDAEVKQADARVKRLETEYNRARNLLASRAISREEFDKVAGDWAEANAAVGSAEAAKAVAKLNLDYTEVKAPVSG